MEDGDEFLQRTRAFTSWLRNIPGVKIEDSVGFADYRDAEAGRGLSATRNIEEGETLFTLPPAAILSTTTARLPSLLPDVFADEDLDHWHALILCLIYECSHVDSSFWKAYLNILPDEFDTLIFWTEDELEELQASAVRAKVGKESADETFREALLPILTQNKDLFFSESASSMTEDDMLALCHRFASTIMAYAFDLSPSLNQRANPQNGTNPTNDEQEAQDDSDSGFATDESEMLQHKGMIPLADLLNAVHPSNARLEQEPGHLIMRATKAIPEGEQIYNTYGELPRSGILRQYGYVHRGYTEFDVVEITLDMVRDHATTQLAESGLLEKGQSAEDEIAKRLVYLDSKGLLEDGYDLPRPCTVPTISSTENNGPDSAIPESLWVLLRTLLSSPDVYKRARAFLREDNAQLHASVYTVLSRILKQRIDQYTTTLTEDAWQGGAFVQGSNGRHHADDQESIRKNRRLRMAVEVRMGEKLILETAMKEVAQELEVLGISSDATDGSGSKSDNYYERPSKRAKVA